MSDQSQRDSSPPSVPTFSGGEFTITRLLGRGGFGSVFLGWDKTLQRQVAIKMLRSGSRSNEEHQGRLLAEARSLATLHHPDIPQILGVQTSDEGDLYAIMEYVPGITARDRLKQGPLPIAKAVEIMAQISDAVAAAHRCSIVHRDIKPENILFAPSGRPMLVDFGIARDTERVFENEPDANRHLDRVLPFGTYGYLSPEITANGMAGPQSDIFSLGCVLYELLTGTMAFPNAGREPNAFKTGVNFSRLPPATPEELKDLLRQAMALDPSDRLGSAATMSAILQSLADRLRVPAKVSSPPRPNVLFVDDEPYYTRPYRQGLEEAGFDVTFVEGASEALQAGDDGEFDAVIVDLQMPRPAEMASGDPDQGLATGAWLLARMLERPWSTKTVFIAISNSGDIPKQLARAGVRLDRVIAVRKIDVPARQLPELLSRAVADMGSSS